MSLAHLDEHLTNSKSEKEMTNLQDPTKKSIQASQDQLATTRSETNGQKTVDYDKILECLKTDPIVRSHKQTRMILNYLNQYANIKQFIDSSDNSELSFQLCKNLTLQQANIGDVIIKENDESNDKLYIIIKGKIGIVRKEDKNIYAKVTDQADELQQLWNTNAAGGSKINDSVENIQSSTVTIEKQTIEKQPTTKLNNNNNEKKSKKTKKGKKGKKKKQEQETENSETEDKIQISEFEILNTEEKDQKDVKKEQKQEEDEQFNMISSAEKLKIQENFKEVKKEKAKNALKRAVNNLTSKNSIGDKFYNLEQMISQQQQIVNQTIKVFGVLINSLSEGQLFGEKAITAKDPKDAKRNATVVCVESTDFVIMQRQDFLKVKNAFDKDLILKQSIIKKLIPPIENINNSYIMSTIMHYFHSTQIGKAFKLTQEGNLGDNLYVLVSGKLTVERKFRNANNPYYNDFSQIQISQIDKPQIIGEEILDDQPNSSPYKYTVIATEYSRCYYVNKTQLLTKFPPDVIPYLKESFKQKEKQRDDTYKQHLGCLDNNTIVQSFAKDVDRTSKQMHFLEYKDIYKNMRLTNIEKYNRCTMNELQNKLSQQFTKKEQLKPRVPTSQAESRQFHMSQHDIDFIDDYRKQLNRQMDQNGIKRLLIKQTMQKYSEFIKQTQFSCEKERELHAQVSKVFYLQTQIQFGKISLEQIKMNDLIMDKKLEEQIAQRNKSLEKNQVHVDNSWKWNKVKSIKFANSEPSDKMYQMKVNNNQTIMPAENKTTQNPPSSSSTVSLVQNGELKRDCNYLDFGKNKQYEKQQYFSLITQGKIKGKSVNADNLPLKFTPIDKVKNMISVRTKKIKEKTIKSSTDQGSLMTTYSYKNQQNQNSNNNNENGNSNTKKNSVLIQTSSAKQSDRYSSMSAVNSPSEQGRVLSKNNSKRILIGQNINQNQSTPNSLQNSKKSSLRYNQGTLVTMQNQSGLLSSIQKTENSVNDSQNIQQQQQQYYFLANKVKNNLQNETSSQQQQQQQQQDSFQVQMENSRASPNKIDEQKILSNSLMTLYQVQEEQQSSTLIKDESRMQDKIEEYKKKHQQRLSMQDSSNQKQQQQQQTENHKKKHSLVEDYQINQKPGLESSNKIFNDKFPQPKLKNRALQLQNFQKSQNYLNSRIQNIQSIFPRKKKTQTKTQILVSSDNQLQEIQNGYQQNYDERSSSKKQREIHSAYNTSFQKKMSDRKESPDKNVSRSPEKIQKQKNATISDFSQHFNLNQHLQNIKQQRDARKSQKLQAMKSLNINKIAAQQSQQFLKQQYQTFYQTSNSPMKQLSHTQSQMSLSYQQQNEDSITSKSISPSQRTSPKQTRHVKNKSVFSTQRMEI